MLTYKPGEVVVDAVSCQPLAELPLFPHQLVSHLVHLLCRALLVVASQGGIRRLLELLLRANKQFLVHLLRWNHVTWGATEGGVIKAAVLRFIYDDVQERLTPTCTHVVIQESVHFII